MRRALCLCAGFVVGLLLSAFLVFVSSRVVRAQVIFSGDIRFGVSVRAFSCLCFMGESIVSGIMFIFRLFMVGEVSCM